MCPQKVITSIVLHMCPMITLLALQGYQPAVPTPLSIIQFIGSLIWKHMLNSPDGVPE